MKPPTAKATIGLLVPVLFILAALLSVVLPEDRLEFSAADSILIPAKVAPNGESASYNQYVLAGTVQFRRAELICTGESTVLRFSKTNPTFADVGDRLIRRGSCKVADFDTARPRFKAAQERHDDDSQPSTSASSSSTPALPGALVKFDNLSGVPTAYRYANIGVVEVEFRGLECDKSEVMRRTVRIRRTAPMQEQLSDQLVAKNVCSHSPFVKRIWRKIELSSWPDRALTGFLIAALLAVWTLSFQAIQRYVSSRYFTPRVILYGARGVGKSTLVEKLITGVTTASDKHETTVGELKFHYGPNGKIPLVVLDSQGGDPEARLRALLSEKPYYTIVVLLLTDGVSRRSLARPDQLPPSHDQFVQTLTNSAAECIGQVAASRLSYTKRHGRQRILRAATLINWQDDRESRIVSRLTVREIAKDARRDLRGDHFAYNDFSVVGFEASLTDDADFRFEHFKRWIDEALGESQ